MQRQSGATALQEIAAELINLKAPSLDERYDINSEPFRENWATNAGYVLLPSLSKSPSVPEDVVDLEVAFVVSSIQSSALKDQELGAFEALITSFLRSMFV